MRRSLPLQFHRRTKHTAHAAAGRLYDLETHSRCRRSTYEAQLETLVSTSFGLLLWLYLQSTTL